MTRQVKATIKEPEEGDLEFVCKFYGSDFCMFTVHTPEDMGHYSKYCTGRNITCEHYTKSDMQFQVDMYRKRQEGQKKTDVGWGL